MANIDDELLLDAEEDLREAEHILSLLSVEHRQHFTTDDIVYMLGAIADYYFESGVLESDDEYVDIDLQAVADYVVSKAEQDGQPRYPAGLVLEVAQADMDYQEQNL